MTNFRLFRIERLCRRKLSKPVENTVGKGEIARYEQFLLFPQCFQKARFAGASKASLCGNGQHFGECACMRATEFVQTITSSIVDEFQNISKQLFSITCRCAI